MLPIGLLSPSMCRPAERVVPNVEAHVPKAVCLPPLWRTHKAYAECARSIFVPVNSGVSKLKSTKSSAFDRQHTCRLGDQAAASTIQ